MPPGEWQDNPANDRLGWSFLKDPGRDRWLLNRVLEQKSLLKRFLTSCKDARWRQAVKERPERLLLLIYVAGGGIYLKYRASGLGLLSTFCDIRPIDVRRAWNTEAISVPKARRSPGVDRRVLV